MNVLRMFFYMVLCSWLVWSVFVYAAEICLLAAAGCGINNECVPTGKYRLLGQEEGESPHQVQRYILCFDNLMRLADYYGYLQ